jgi:hypothetical protein
MPMVPFDASTREKLLIIINGCKRHKPYRGQNPPNADCFGCREVYDAVQGVLPILIDVPETYYNKEMCLHCMLAVEHTLDQHVRAVADTRHGR